MINIIISNTSGKPIYQQVFDQLSAQILRSQLPSGEMLPPIRTVAKELRISVITVKKAWEDLERSGFIYSMVGRGCFVADLTPHELTKKATELVGKKMAKDIAYYKVLGLSQSDIIDAVKSLYNK